ncbi:glutamate synthase-related protein [Streptomyces sp. NPDC098789]|uniref:glutamate synthase-related protein n=1 Tax=Streptomyces sp. NPDC098789 TaxID=3366098 RepID=UPI003821716F
MPKTLLVALLTTTAAGASVAAVLVSPWWWVAGGPLLLVALVAVHDVAQRRRSVLRNYPVLGHLRFALEAVRPEVQQYFVERNVDGRPYDRDTRSIVYERAKGTDAEEPFGTELDLYRPGSEYLTPSMAPRPVRADPPRVRIGGPGCTRPYDMALLNVSAMSFGSLSANAVLALNTGARLGGFAHDTGEGDLSQHHLRPGGDLVWEVGTGLRDRIRIGASGKVATGGDLVKRLLQGADYTNAARAMMFALGCIQAQRCHANTCPVGVATQDRRRARALVVGDKAERVRRYQRSTVESALPIMASMGVEGPGDLRPHMLLHRVDPHTVRSYAELHAWLLPGQLLASPPQEWAGDRQAADPDRFAS